VSEHRRLRFSDILGIERSDLPFACDIWLEDIYRAPWVTREVMKLAAYFVRYMAKPDANALSLREVESQIQMAPEELRKTLVLMRNFNAVEGFLIERNDIRVGLKLSHLQRLRVLEARSRFAALLAEPITHNWPWTTAEDRWVPGEAAKPAGQAPAAVVVVSAPAMPEHSAQAPEPVPAPAPPPAAPTPVPTVVVPGDAMRVDGSDVPLAPAELPPVTVAELVSQTVDIMQNSGNTTEFPQS
jgi:hypothetical protein